MAPTASPSRIELLEIVANAHGVWTPVEESAYAQLLAEIQDLIEARRLLTEL